VAPDLGGTSLWARLGANQRPLLCEGNGIAPNGHTGRDAAGPKWPLNTSFVSGVSSGVTEYRDVWRPFCAFGPFPLAVAGK
jgi:hypothetical protein